MDTTSLVSAWNSIVLQLCYIFTEPSAGTWQQIVLGWVLRRGCKTVTGIVRTLGDLVDRHWTVYEKFFYRTRRSLKELSVALLTHVIYPMILESGVLVGAGPYNSQTAVFFFTKANGQIGVYGGTTFWGTSYTSLTWYKIRFAFNWMSKEIDYYVNDSLVKGGITFRSTSVLSLTIVYLYNYSNSQAWWDEIEFSSGSVDYISPGTIISTQIDLLVDGSWGDVNFSKTTPANTSLTVDVLDASDDTVILADVASGTDLSGIAATSIKLRANLATSDSAVTPALHDWSVTYTTPALACESDWSNVESSLQCATPGDFEPDCDVDWADLAVLAGQWLQIPGTPSADIAPLPNGDGKVNFLDFAEFAIHWLEGTE
jgi:hypothetical protein